MTSNERWPLLNLLAGHVLYLGEPDEFKEIDCLELDRTETQVRTWLADVAAGLDAAELKERVRVATHHRAPQDRDDPGLQPWHDYVFVFDRDEVLIEEVLSVRQVPGEEAIRIRRFRRQPFSDCSPEILALF